MLQKSILIALSLVLCTAPASFAQDPAPKTPAQAPAGQGGDVAGPTLPVDRIVPTKDSAFGEPLFVNGRRVTDEEIKLYIIYGPGKLLLELYRNNFVTEDEIARQANENVEFEFQRREATQPFPSKEARKKEFDAAVAAELERLHAKYKISDEELQKEYDASIEDFKKTYPILNVPAEISRSFRSIDWYVRQLKQALYFDRVFLPPNPEEWPTVTIEAMRADSGEILIEDALKSYKDRKEISEKSGDPLVKEDVVYWNMMRQIVRDAVYKTLDIRTSIEGIPPGLALWIDSNHDGKPELEVKTDDMWARMADTVTPAEVDEAKHWFVTYYATRDRLEKEGAAVKDLEGKRYVLTPDECQKALMDVEKSLEGSYMTVDIFATAELMFPSVEVYKSWTCLREGFKRYMSTKLDSGPAGDLSPLLRDYAVQANKIMGLGTVDIDVLLVSAFDIPHNRWKPNGWAWAKAKAEEINAAIAKNLQENAEERRRKAEAKAEGKEYVAEREVVEPLRFWTQMMEDHSEYWDPPPPDGAGKKISEANMKKRGRFGPKYRNDLQPFIGETPLRHWVTGESITDYAFFEQGEGTVAGPFKGPLGYYLTRVAKRTGPTRPLNFADPRHKDLLRDDYLRVAFVQFAKESVAKATIKGY